MESWRARAPIDPARCYFAVGSPPPGRAQAAKGAGVHWLKGDVSWVQNGVIRCGFLYPALRVTSVVLHRASDDPSVPRAGKHAMNILPQIELMKGGIADEH